MSFPLRYAVLLDGAFVIRKLEKQLGRFPTAEDIQALAASIHAHEYVADFSRLRIYFYHAHPAAGTLVNPLSKCRVLLSVQALVVVTGDSDLVPAFKFARREGLRIFLCHMGHRIKRELLIHADRDLRVKLPKGTVAPRHERGLVHAVSESADRCP